MFGLCDETKTNNLDCLLKIVNKKTIQLTRDSKISTEYSGYLFIGMH